MRACLATLLVLLLPFSVRGASFSPDISGLWWNPDESGWGVNLIQQGNIIFATFFVYGDDGRGRWFTASDMRSAAAPGDRPIVFTGKLYESTGPGFKSSGFDANAVVRREVGDARFEYLSPEDRGTLTYTVEGVQVTKQIRRQTWAVNDITGHFLVSRVLRGENCPPATPVVEPLGTMEVVRSGEDVHILTRPIPPYPSLSCGYSGTYTQEGRLGTITGGHTCGDMTSGNFVLTEIEVTSQGFSAKLSQTFAGCTRTGTFGGPRATVP